MTCVCNEEPCAYEGSVGVDQLRRSQRIQEDQEEEASCQHPEIVIKEEILEI